MSGPASVRSDVPVLIAGGGLIGLSAAMFLAQHGILRSQWSVCAAARSFARLLPHAHEDVPLSRHRGRGARAVAQGVRAGSALIIMDTLAGKKLADIIPSLNEGVDALSPCRRLFVTQPGLEPILRRRAEAAGAKVLDGYEAVGVEQDADGVTLTVQDVEVRQAKQAARAISARRRRRAQSDTRAPRHSVRRTRRVLEQHHHLLPCRSRPAAPGQAAERHLHQQRHARRLLPHGQGLQVGLPRGQHRRRSQKDPKAAADAAADISEARLIEFVRAGAGIPDLPVKIDGVARWRATSDVAQIP